MRIWPGNRTTRVELAYALPERERSQLSGMHLVELLTRFQRPGLRYGHPGSWEVTSFGPGPAPQQFYGQEALRLAGQKGAQAKDIQGAIESVVFVPLGAMNPETVI